MAKKDGGIPMEILAMAEERLKAKKARDFATADKIRNEILARGYKIEDTPQGVRIIAVD